MSPGVDTGLPGGGEEFRGEIRAIHHPPSQRVAPIHDAITLGIGFPVRGWRRLRQRVLFPAGAGVPIRGRIILRHRFPFRGIRGFRRRCRRFRPQFAQPDEQPAQGAFGLTRPARQFAPGFGEQQGEFLPGAFRRDMGQRRPGAVEPVGVVGQYPGARQGIVPGKMAAGAVGGKPGTKITTGRLGPLADPLETMGRRFPTPGLLVQGGRRVVTVRPFQATAGVIHETRPAITMGRAGEELFAAGIGLRLGGVSHFVGFGSLQVGLRIIYVPTNSQDVVADA